jgi:O-antigen/teichoic acid export membrane protein
MASGALISGRNLLQNFLITQHFQFATLGIFSRAESLANMFCGRVSQEISNSLYPVITRVEAQSERFQRINGLVLQCVMWISIPIAIFFAFEAENIVKLLYGKKWLAVIPLLPLVMAMAVTVSISAVTYRLLLANNQSRLCLYSDLTAFPLAAMSMVLLIPHGVNHYIIGATVVGAVIATLLLYMLVKTHGLKAMKLIVVILPPSLAGFFGLLLVWLVKPFMLNQLPIVMQILFSGALFTASYCFLLRILFRKNLAEIIEYVPGGKRLERALYL